MKGLVNVAATFAETEILLTGGNGFLGKVLIALLLDRYPDVRRLHLLLRPRRDRGSEERFEQEILGSPPLLPLVERLGSAFLREKIRIWEGDAAQPLGGLDASQIAEWAGRIGLIVNSAGLVEFFPPVHRSLTANVDAVERLADLARKLGAKLLHVSTCYVAGQADGLVEESDPILGFYPQRTGPNDHSFDADRELAVLRTKAGRITAGGTPDRAALEALTGLGRERAEQWGWVNTYTYTKSLGEQVLAAQTNLESAIVRPAIVESALRFPFPGWIEGGRTAAPLVLMALSGMRDWPARADLALEIVPVDLVAAGVWTAGALLLAGSAAPVYQLASADVNPFEMDGLLRLLTREGRRRPLNGSAGAGPVRLLSAAEFRLRMEQLRIDAELAEKRLNQWAGRLEKARLPGAASLRRRAGALRRRALQASFRESVIEQYLPFIREHRYVFESQNVRDANRRLRPEDRQKLPWDPEAIDWPSYWRENQIEGVLRWIQPEAVKEWSIQI